jgi:hypothetical protein
MWTSRLKEVRERRNRWHIEGDFVDSENAGNISFSISLRFGWLAMESISSPLFERVLEHFSAILGEPKEPPTCAGASECQDDAVHLTTSWEIDKESTSVQSLLCRLLNVSEDKLTAT